MDTAVITPPAFAAIGSPHTPDAIRPIIDSACAAQYAAGRVMRTTANRGADEMFETAYQNLGGNIEIYLPYKGYQNRQHGHHHVGKKGLAITKDLQPNWDMLSKNNKRLLARCLYALLGPDLKSPVSILLCAAPDGTITGSVGMAIRAAKAYEIPFVNLYDVLKRHGGDMNDVTISGYSAHSGSCKPLALRAI